MSVFVLFYSTDVSQLPRVKEKKFKSPERIKSAKQQKMVNFLNFLLVTISID